MKKYLEKQNFLQFLSIILVLGITYYTIGAEIETAWYFLLGTLFSFVIFNPLFKNDHSNDSWQILSSVGISIYVSSLLQSNIESGVLILVGLNLSAFLLQLKNISTKTINVNIVNVSSLVSILLSSGIQKFRGYNKLIPEDIQYTIPILLLIFLLIYLISKVFSIKKEKFSAILVILIAFIALLPLQMFYKETGPDLILIPIICGMFAKLSLTYIRPKTILNEIFEVSLLMVLPYQISGFMGIGFSYLGYVGLSYISGANMYESTTSNIIRVSKYIPLLFLFTIQEIRENKGLINKLDITNGYIAGWVVLSAMYSKWISYTYKKIRSIMEQNEVLSYWPQAMALFTLMTFTVVYKFGKFESAIAIVFGSVLYLFIISGLEKNLKKERSRLILSLSSFLGSLSLLVLLA